MPTKTRWLGVVTFSSFIALAAGCGGAKERKEAYIKHGEKYLAQHKYEKARVEFGNAMQIDPKDARAHYFAGQVAEKLEDPRGAAGQYMAAVDLDPKNQTARAALARLYVLGGVPDKALELVATGLAMEPKNADLLVVRAAAKARLNNFKDAVDDAETALQLAPDNDYAISLMASLYKRQGQAGKAIDVVRAGVQRLPDNVDLRIVLADLDMDQQHFDEAETQLKKAIELEPKVLDRRYLLARFYLLTKNVDAAEATMREAIAAAPDEVKPKLMLVGLLADQRGKDKAVAEMQKFIKAEPDNDPLKLAYADYLQAQNVPDQAESTYRAVIAHAGVRADGLTARDHLAEMMLKRNDAAQAQTLINEVLKENPRDNDALTMRGNIELAHGDMPAAITDFRSVLRDQPGSLPVARALARAHLQNDEPQLAEEVLNTAAAANPKDIEIRLDLAQVQEHSGKIQQARSLLEQLVSEAPDKLVLVEELFRAQMTQKDYAAARATAENLEHKHADNPLGFYLAGLVDKEQKKFDAATADFERSLAIQPQAAEPLAAVVRMDVERKQPKRAMDRLDAVIAKYPDDITARGLKAELLFSQAQYDDAARVYQDAISKQPSQWLLYQGLARTQIAAKHEDAAAATLSQGIEKNPDANGLITDLALLYEHMNRLDDAIAVYESAIKRNPNSMVAANNLAMLLVNHRSDAASLSRAQQLTALLEKSQDSSFVDTRGWVDFKSGDTKDAAMLLKQAVDRSPNSSVLQYHLGMVQFKTGDLVNARKNLEAALASGKSFSGDDEARTALEQIKHQK